MRVYLVKSVVSRCGLSAAAVSLWFRRRPAVVPPSFPPVVSLWSRCGPAVVSRCGLSAVSLWFRRRRAVWRDELFLCQLLLGCLAGPIESPQLRQASKSKP